MVFGSCGLIPSSKRLTSGSTRVRQRLIELNPAADMANGKQIHGSECMISQNLFPHNKFEAPDEGPITLMDLTHSGGTTDDIVDGFWRKDTKCEE